MAAIFVHPGDHWKPGAVGRLKAVRKLEAVDQALGRAGEEYLRAALVY